MLRFNFLSTQFSLSFAVNQRRWIVNRHRSPQILPGRGTVDAQAYCSPELAFFFFCTRNSPDHRSSGRTTGVRTQGPAVPGSVWPSAPPVRLLTHPHPE